MVQIQVDEARVVSRLYRIRFFVIKIFIKGKIENIFVVE